LLFYAAPVIVKAWL